MRGRCLLVERIIELVERSQERCNRLALASVDRTTRCNLTTERCS